MEQEPNIFLERIAMINKIIKYIFLILFIILILMSINILESYGINKIYSFIIIILIANTIILFNYKKLFGGFNVINIIIYLAINVFILSYSWIYYSM